ncbi:hypothetical protein SAMN04487969_1562 [Paenibacillus algorifonticola]|uniref:Uncharacterized protein n=1 Tax=Paenibacillus algorifonticola TaxID=684063 RepID=A0A1I2J472_9BACL|nr:hypothetical protein [Paenibacillus algorifonticola]SFF49542.1 hypothetical protein SAMN04487969_1562 [Paenibacillus algorifonticola]
MGKLNIKKHNGRYTITCISDLDKKEIAKILIQFVTSDSEQLLFEYFRADPYYWDEDMVKSDKEDFYDLFLNNKLLFHNESTKDNLILKISELLKNYCEYDGKEVNEVTLNEFAFPENIVESIKTLIYEVVLTEEDPKILNFINGKIEFINHSWYDMETDKLKSNPLANVRWYKVQDMDEIVGAISITEVYFKCLLHQKNSELENYDCAIIYYEAESDFHLEVVEVEHGFFEKKVLPKLNNLFQDISFSHTEE